MPQGVRSGAQGSVVHRLPLEKSLPTLPRLKKKKKQLREGESVRHNEVDGRMSDKRDFYQKEVINQGPRAIKKTTVLLLHVLFFFYFQPFYFLS